jgi:microcystin-dependent protein
MDPFVAEIRIFPFNFAPRNGRSATGSSCPSRRIRRCFALLGTIYGGDGKSNFALRTCRAGPPCSLAQGSGLSRRDLGEIGGAETVTLLTTEMPAHTHNWRASSGDGNEQTPNGQLLATGVGGISAYAASNAGAQNQLAFQAMSPAGGSQPHNNMQPYLTLNFCIALQGVFPPRP